MPYVSLRNESWQKLSLPPYATEVLQLVAAWSQGEAYFTLQTSGSTGKPKPILLHRKQLEISARMGMDFFQVPDTLPLLLCLSVQHIAGVMQVVRALVYGHNLHVLKVGRTALQLMQPGRRYGLISVVPLQLQEAVRKGCLSCLEQCHTVLVGGAALFPSTEKALSALKTRTYHSYGMSETAAHVALRRLHAPTSPYFVRMKGVYLSCSKTGCLQIRSPSTNHRITQTQDLVQMQGKGRFKWLGRADAVINSGGVKLHLDELDRELGDRWLEANEGKNTGGYFSYGLPDEVLGQRLVWFVEQAPSLQVRTYFLNSLKSMPPYHTPKSICVVAPFILTASGKIDKIATCVQNFQEHSI